MARRLVSKLILRHSLSQNLAIINQCVVCKKASLSTLPKIDVNDNSTKDPMSSWKLCAAVCLIRLPIQEKEKSELEQKYLKMREQLEYEHSVYNKWELEGQRQLQMIKDIETGVKNPEDIDFKETTQDLEDAYEATYNNFKQSSIELAPEDRNMKNINRRSRDYIIFATKQKLGNDQVWMLPGIEWQHPETMKETAVRALEHHCGKMTEAFFTSNAPSGFYKYKFPKTARDKHVGAKLFIYNAFLPRVSETKSTYNFDAEKLSREIVDYAWVARDEMRSLMKPKYGAVIDRIVLKR